MDHEVLALAYRELAAFDMARSLLPGPHICHEFKFLINVSALIVFSIKYHPSHIISKRNGSISDVSSVLVEPSLLVNMSLPSFAPFPPIDVLEQLLPDELEACLEAWILLSHGYLLLPQVTFSEKVAEEPFVTEFLVSYMSANLQVDIKLLNAPKVRALRSNVFKLTHRTFMEFVAIPSQLLEYTFLENLSVLYGAPNLHGHNSNLSDIVIKAWDVSNLNDAPPSFAKQRASLIHTLSTNKQDILTELDKSFLRTACVLSVSYQYGQYLTVGSDFLDVLSGYFQSNARVQKGIVIVAHLCLTSLIHPKRPMFSTLIDHLYAMKSSPAGKSMLQTLCSTTSLLRKLRHSLSGAEATRAQPLMDELSTFKIDVKGKGKTTDRRVSKHRNARRFSSSDERSTQEIERITLVTQIKDLFPELDTQVINDLLHKNNGDMERVTAHILDGSLGAYAAQSEKTSTKYVFLSQSLQCTNSYVNQACGNNTSSTSGSQASSNVANGPYIKAIGGPSFRLRWGRLFSACCFSIADTSRP